ncbi:hypothetical protein ABOM_006067 [Aspergillus bombycis]|uniref:Rhodopsin domain-containing protein n=1 Tax=Aspergillus bombycis TaxID=109264 RepID=A0A1F8A284_9EURO|nr:hypothetical protein ABOM_006067 [Aspergillus bombycis]OGM45840.1 hypothetical protein ABOM_006067 [Aspergillus bombycis]
MNSPSDGLRNNVIAVNVLAVVSIVLRFVARHIRRVTVGADDYLIVASLALLFTISGIALGMIHYGLGYNQVDLPAESSLMVAKLLYVFEIFYVINLLTIKLSILMMYRRIFTNISRLFRVGAMICGAVVTLWATAFVPAAIFQCTPVAKAWDIDIPGHCISLQLAFYCVALPNILTDVAILSLPIRSCWQLHRSILYRLSLIGIFMMGIFVVGVSIYRFTTLFLYSPHNVPGTIGPSTIWSVIECAVGIVCACLPTITPVLRIVCHKFNCPCWSEGQSGPRNNVNDDSPTPARRRVFKVWDSVSFSQGISTLPTQDTRTTLCDQRSLMKSPASVENNDVELAHLTACSTVPSGRSTLGDSTLPPGHV